MLSLRAAAEEFHINRKTLRAAVDAGIVTCAHDRNSWPRFDRDTLERELSELPSCAAASCERQALGPSGYCSRHASIPATAKSLRASRVPVEQRDYLTFAECLTAGDLDWATLDRAVARGELADDRIGHCRTIRRETFHSWLAARSAEHAAYFAFCASLNLAPSAGESKTAYAEVVAKREGRLTTTQLRRELGDVTQSSATRHVRSGRLRATELRVYGVVFYQYDPEDVREFKREQWQLAKRDGRRMAWLDPNHAPQLEQRRIKRLTLVLGNETAAIGAVKAMVETRRRAYSSAASGRRPTSKPERWAALHQQLKAQMESERRFAIENDLADDGPVSDYAAAIAVAEADCADHPDDWKSHRAWDAESKTWTLDPSPNVAKGAANRVLMALARREKRLQIGYTKSKAA